MKRAAALAAAVLAAAAITWLAWPSPPGANVASRVRQYRDIRACMLTGPRGLADQQAAAAWSGMQGVSASTSGMVSYQPVPGPATRATALPYLASLVQRQCNVIVAVGAAQVAAVSADAGRFRAVRFIVITRTPGRPGVVRIAPAPPAQPDSAVRTAVSAALSAG